MAHHNIPHRGVTAGNPVRLKNRRQSPGKLWVNQFLIDHVFVDNCQTAVDSPGKELFQRKLFDCPFIKPVNIGIPLCIGQYIAVKHTAAVRVQFRRIRKVQKYFPRQELPIIFRQGIQLKAAASPAVAFYHHGADGGKNLLLRIHFIQPAKKLQINFLKTLRPI